MKSPRKHILFLCSWFPNREKALEGNFILKHATYIQTFVNVHLCFARSSKDNVEKFELEEEIIEGVRVTKVYYKSSTLPVLKTFINLQRYVKAMKMAYAKGGVAYDLAHVNVAFPAGLFALHLKRKHNLPYIITEHWSGYLSATKIFEKSSSFIKKIHQRIFKEAQHIFTVSNTLGEALKQHQLINDFEVLPNYIDVNLFSPSAQKASIFTFVHVSTVDEMTKNFNGILTALRGLKEQGFDFNFNLVVEADEKEVAEKLRKFGLDELTNLYSYLPSKEVARVIGESHCLIQFSNFETFSIVLAEAWLSGIPCVYSKCGGLTDLADTVLGIQVNKKDVNQLQSALRQMISEGDTYSPNDIHERAKSFLSPALIREKYERLLV
ncbi:Glycosyltransferase involved in cell wall bisynthesis [Lishizhenia tianjinensis]|uniref:Glycosyltransferase involved in cell wall bisynthesis n=1 Tax=Lishizhenia tianjinensis TaxID=477690 RepID=A0A1I6Z009_9FLAO|nr:glycosyltransferase family 4 protein [Lishizhenia tianjinensis]SFT55968.1 Glycosyltransferase involved in cell wall bisynthesis [Lishizhenia tianjinensis]